MTVTPDVTAIAVAAIEPLRPRLVDVDAAAQFLGVSAQVVRDYVGSGRLPAVRLPAARIDMGPRLGGKGKRYQLVPHTDPRLRGADPLKRILIDVADLDALVEAAKVRG